MTQKLHYTNEQLEGDLVELTRQMAIDEFKPSIIIGPGRGAFIPGVMLSHFYNVPFEGFTWQSRDGSEEDRGTLSKILDKHLRGDMTNMLIIDDINDTGKTLSDIMGYVRTVSMLVIGQSSIKVATLFSKEQSEFKTVDYYARSLTLDNNPWVIFPYENWWKHQ